MVNNSMILELFYAKGFTSFGDTFFYSFLLFKFCVQVSLPSDILRGVENLAEIVMHNLDMQLIKTK